LTLEIGNLTFFMFLPIALLGYFFLAIVAISDKYILTSEKVRPIAFVFYSAFPVLVVFFLLPFYGQPFDFGKDFFVATVSGVSFTLALWAMYRGFLKSEVSHIGPLVGGSIPLFVLIFSSLFLAEYLTNSQLFGVFLLSVGTLAVAFEYKKNHYELNSAMLWGLVAAALFAVSHVSAKYLYNSYDFWTGFIWTRGIMGVFGAMLLVSPVLRRNLFKRTPPTKKTKIPARSLPIIVINKILAIVGVVLVQYAIALGSVTVINALAGVQYALLIILVFLLSRFWPKLFKEEYSKSEIIQEVGAIVLIGLGLAMIV